MGLGGALFGVTVLLKESVLPLALLPLALVGSGSWRRVATLGAIYLGAAVVTAGWWWVAVWVGDGAIFPLNNLAVVGARDVGRGLGLGRVMLLLGGAAALGWAAMVVRARAELGPRGWWWWPGHASCRQPSMPPRRASTPGTTPGSRCSRPWRWGSVARRWCGSWQLGPVPGDWSGRA